MRRSLRLQRVSAAAALVACTGLAAFVCALPVLASLGGMKEEQPPPIERAFAPPAFYTAPLNAIHCWDDTVCGTYAVRLPDGSVGEHPVLCKHHDRSKAPVRPRGSGKRA
jgi:hypothetical protein